MGFTTGRGGRKIWVRHLMESGFHLIVNESLVEINYDTPVDFYRALAMVNDALKNGYDVNVVQKPAFKKCALMMDVSRGAVMKVEKVKDFIRRIARMGFNEFMLYTEDVYEIKKYPYFGYMRGRYTEKELCEIVEYGNQLGIETIPCIQTLGHLTAALRWADFAAIKDQSAVLMIGEEESYKFIEEMIKTVRRCFTTSQIHIGMDEAQGVGLGNYLQKNGFQDCFTILSDHLYRVLEICKKHDFEPMMWSDMFFRLGTPDGGYYNVNASLPENIAELIPEGISQVYWDYYNNSEKFYNVMISEHKRMKCPIIFAGGVWSFTGPSVNNRQSIVSTIPALKVCKEQGINHVIATLWGDDGTECDYYQALYSLQLFAEYNYNGENALKKLDEMFKVCNGVESDAFKLLDIDCFDTPLYCEEEPDFAELHDCIINTSKQALYQNPLMGLFDKNFEHVNLREHYLKIYESLKQIKIPAGFEKLFAVHIQLVKILISKCDIGIRIKTAYDSRDINGLKQLAKELKTLAEDFEELTRLRKSLWYENNKPFGFEPILIRLVGIQALTQIAQERIEGFVDGEFDLFEELEQERLLYNSVDRPFFLEYFSKKIMMPNENE